MINKKTKEIEVRGWWAKKLKSLKKKLKKKLKKFKKKINRFKSIMKKFTRDHKLVNIMIWPCNKSCKKIYIILMRYTELSFCHLF